MAERDSVSSWWVVLFLLLAIGLGAVAVVAVGGSLVASGPGALVPVLV